MQHDFFSFLRTKMRIKLTERQRRYLNIKSWSHDGTFIYLRICFYSGFTATWFTYAYWIAMRSGHWCKFELLWTDWLFFAKIGHGTCVAQMISMLHDTCRSRTTLSWIWSQEYLHYMKIATFLCLYYTVNYWIRGTCIILKKVDENTCHSIILCLKLHNECDCIEHQHLNNDFYVK